MARYRKVEPKTWRDDKFRQLSAPQPNGQTLWMWLLTGPCTTNIPGVLLGTDAVMAAEIRWPLKAFREAFGEASAKGMAKADFDAGLVWLKNSLRPGDDRNKPESPNVVRSWRDTWDEIPECSLKIEMWQQLKAFTKGLGEGFHKAFLEACRQPSPNQEQEQEQEQNIDSELKLDSALNGDETKPKRAKAKRPGKRVPHDHSVEHLREWAAAEHPTVNFDRQVSKWRDHEYRTPKSDWDAAFRTWMGNAEEYASRNGAGRPQQAEPPMPRKFGQ